MKLIIKNYVTNLLNILYLEIIYHILIFKTFTLNEVLFILLFSLINTLLIDITCSLTKNKTVNREFITFKTLKSNQTIIEWLFFCQFLHFYLA